MDHAQIILSAILPTDKDRLLHATAFLEAEHFRSPVQRGIFQMLEKYFEQTGGILGKPALLDLLERSSVEPSKYILFEEIFDSACNTPVSEHEFRYCIDALKEAREKQLTGEMITTAYTILEKGETVGKETLEGHKDAKDFLYSELSRIDRLAGGAEAAPEGDMSLETAQFLNHYIDVKTGKVEKGIKTGIKVFDDATGGINTGDLALIAAFTNAGKSQMCVQFMWEAAVVQGKNVFYSTSETVRDTIIRRLIARHSLLPQFEYPKGLDSTAIKMGKLTVQEEKVLQAVLDDIASNKDYGKMYISQIPRGATLSYLEAKMRRQQQSWNVDLAICDYLNLIKPDIKRTSQREEANDIIKDAKVLATSFDGKGIAFVSPWQMSRAAHDLAQQQGFYSLSSLADTSEAEKTPDLIATLLRFPDTPKKAKFQLLKCRDSAIPPTTELDIDFRCSYFKQSDSSSGFSNMATLGLGFGNAASGI